MKHDQLKRMLLTGEEKKVLGRLAEVSGMDCWFTIADRMLDNAQKRKVKRAFCYDRVFDLEEGKCVEVREALADLDEGLTEDDLAALTDGERRTYGLLLGKYGVRSTNRVESGDGAVFRDKGHPRRLFRWSCMDELANALVCEDAVARWNSDGCPRMKCSYAGDTRPETMDDFRGDPDKLNLTEEEFNRVSELFRECINMGNTDETE